MHLINHYWLLVIVFVAAASTATGAMGNDRFDVWQAQQPYVLSAWGTHNRGGGGKLDVDYFLARSLSEKSVRARVGGP